MDCTRIAAAIAFVVAIVATAGCGRATHIGLHTGAAVPLQSVKTFEHRTDSATSVPSALQEETFGMASTIGLRFRHRFPSYSSLLIPEWYAREMQESTKNAFMMFEPTLHLGRRDRFVIREGRPGNHFVEIEVEYTGIDIPFYVGGSFPSLGTKAVTPHIAVGLGFTAAVRSSITTDTYRIAGDGTKEYSDIPIDSDYNTGSLFVAGLAGVNWKVHKRWSVSVDARYRLSLGRTRWQTITLNGEDWCQTYEIRAPVKQLGLSASILLNL